MLTTSEELIELIKMKEHAYKELACDINVEGADDKFYSDCYKINQRAAEILGLKKSNPAPLCNPEHTKFIKEGFEVDPLFDGTTDTHFLIDIRSKYSYQHEGLPSVSLLINQKTYNHSFKNWGLPDDEFEYIKHQCNRLLFMRPSNFNLAMRG